MKVLFVEDDPQILKYVRQGLEQKGIVVDTASDGQQGFELASSEEYDMIILDWMLPEMDGLQFCTQLRDGERQTPILMLTAKGSTQDRVTGLNQGADDYLVKPFAFSELLARIHALVRRSRSLQSNNKLDNDLTFRDLMIDVQKMDVKRGKKTIKLSKREYALLEYLLRKKNQVVSAQQIIEHVWEYDSDVLENTAQVYIGYLRKKIDKAFPNKVPLIHTIRGFGYYLGDKK